MVKHASRLLVGVGYSHQSRSTLHVHDPFHRRHVSVQVRHDPERAEDEQHHDQDAEREREHIVDAVLAGRDVQEEDEVHAHLRQRED